MTSVVLIPGDGIGPEVASATREILAAAGARIDWIESPAGMAAMQKYGEPLPDVTLELHPQHRVALKGPCTTPVGKGFRSINVRLRRDLVLYASVRPVKTMPGVKVPYENVDLVIVRENTEGLYAGLEHVVVPGVVESLRLVTREGAERIIRYAFEYARNHGRRKVTVVHKADVMPLSDGRFLKIAEEVADDYPFLEWDTKKIDELALGSRSHEPGEVRRPRDGEPVRRRHERPVCGFGGWARAGSRREHRAASASRSSAVHGSAPDIAGKGSPTRSRCCDRRR